MTLMIDDTVFPHPVYKDTVLAPLFEGAKKHYVDSVRAINQAHLVMLYETGIVPGEQCTSIANALVDIDTSVDISSLSYTGEYEDYFFLVEAELRKRLGPDIAGMLHTGRSRNDMDHTIFKLVLQNYSQGLLRQVLALAEVLHQKAIDNVDTLIVAYTHGQPAQPTTLGHYLSAVLEVLLRDGQRLTSAMDNLNHCPMGAAAITTSGFPIDRERMAALLGFEGILRNSYGCIASVDYVTGLYSAIKLIFLHLGRVIQDFQFWTAFEVGQLYIPNSLVQISSIMPQKRNPVPIEHLRHLASVTCGRCDTLVNTMHNTPFTDMNDSEGEVQQAGYATFESGGRVLELLSAVVAECSVTEARVAKNIDAACITITELADTLVRTEGLSFRQAHEIAAMTAQVVINANQSLGDGYDAFSEAFRKQANRATTLAEPDYRTAVAASTFVAVRERPGGPGPGAMRDSLTLYRATMDSLVANLDSSIQHRVSAKQELDSCFSQLR
ncbi:MAG: argininosuccinate lyase [Granulosicoccus sp.]|nr:argininosuccinate lyase [Granulosicoccus sp.]